MLKKNFFSALFIFTILLMAGDHSNIPQIPSINITFDTKNSHNVDNAYSRKIHAPEWNNHNKKNNNYYAHLTAADFQIIFVDTLSEYDVLSNYELYAYSAFCEYARSLSGYNDFIMSLATKIKVDKHFRRETAYIPGFAYSFGLRGEKSGFHAFIKDEIRRIEQLRTLQKHTTKQGNLRLDEQVLSYLGQEWSAKNKIFGTNKRIAGRLNALHVTGNHKNKCTNVSFATELDYQLYKELIECSNAINQLERKFTHSHHMYIVVPMVRDCVAQAARQKCPIVAFQLSDFCHTVTQVLKHGMHVLYDMTHAVAKGVAKGAASIVSVDHWKNMAAGCLQLGLLFADAVGQEDALHYAVISSVISQDSDVLLKSAQQYCMYTQSQKDTINLCVQETYKKLKSVTWQELLENGIEIGTTLILDILTFHVVGGFARAGSNAFLKQLSKVSESGVLFTEHYALEVAGFGKLIADEGAGFSGEALNIVEQNLTKFESNNGLLSQVIKEKIATNQITFQMAETIAIDGELFSDLQSIGNNIWQSIEGVIYGYDRKFGNALNHILAHFIPNPMKVNHTVFSIPKEKIVALIDEAWIIKGNPLVSDLRAYLIDMKKIIGINGETALKIIVREPGTSEIITAYPVRI